LTHVACLGTFLNPHASTNTWQLQILANAIKTGGGATIWPRGATDPCQKKVSLNYMLSKKKLQKYA
jgi:hypothetical protein